MADAFQAELIGGIVYVASPLRRRHGTHHLPLASVFFAYQSHTPGVEAAANATILLGDDAEPQPDLYLRILPERGGQSRTTDDDYVAGAPELVAEIAHSSRAIDLHAKKHDYSRYGVLEYVVVSLEEPRLWWFDLRADTEILPDDGRVCRLRSFPGLWIDIPALFARDFRGLMATLEQGLDSPEHDAFVRRLAGR
jgi:Uma2 family endonuclease